jgi:hypothetical protein
MIEKSEFRIPKQRLKNNVWADAEGLTRLNSVVEIQKI